MRVSRVLSTTVAVALCLMMSACTNDSEKSGESAISHHTEHPHVVELTNSPHENATPAKEQQLADAAKDAISEMEHITEIHAVSLENHVFISAAVEHHARWNLKDVQKQAETELEEQLPSDADIHFSTDLKAFKELKNLEEDIVEQKVDGWHLHERLLKIKEFMKPV
ncbi:YhcN/YlaJ family sporulation lipoprotein [Geomicrobium sp. JSM 1781026]|uniref:YhcN/YlaJ family sporulation lipoprotein n=1 Tax=Geomicrobium sp. JSM 1781026 TaxID=3344580 RepID=UPI0035C1131C